MKKGSPTWPLLRSLGSFQKALEELPPGGSLAAALLEHSMAPTAPPENLRGPASVQTAWPGSEPGNGEVDQPGVFWP